MIVQFLFEKEKYSLVCVRRLLNVYLYVSNKKIKNKHFCYVTIIT